MSSAHSICSIHSDMVNKLLTVLLIMDSNGGWLEFDSQTFDFHAGNCPLERLLELTVVDNPSRWDDDAAMSWDL